MKTQTQEILKNGDTVYNSGHRFIARNVRKSPHGLAPSGQEVWHYEGECFPGESLENTGFNGGTYSWRKGEAFNAA